MDINRTNVELSFFKESCNKNILIDVLTVWSGRNLDMSYRQGMNEIAATILLALSEETLDNPYPNATDSELLESYK